MKIKVWVETEVEASVSLDDVVTELNNLPRNEGRRSALAAINSAIGVLQRISVERISELHDGQRDLVGKVLQEQANLYLTSKIDLTGGVPLDAVVPRDSLED
jgi:hypothetical protein